MRRILLGLLMGCALQFATRPEAECRAAELPATATVPRDPAVAAEVVSALEAETLPELFPLQWAALQGQLNQLLAEQRNSGRGEFLLAAARALWDDYGAAEINEANQWFLTGMIADELSKGADSLEPAARQELAGVIREYIEDGGAEIEPDIMASVGLALAALLPADAEAQETADYLIYEALVWDAELSSLMGAELSMITADAAELHFGPAVFLDMYELLECRVDPANEPACYRRRCETIARLLGALSAPAEEPGRDNHVARYAVRACREVLQPCGSDEAMEDLCCRFLLAVEWLLRGRRNTLSEGLVDRISDTLAALAAKRKITTPRAWKRWAGAVDALGSGRMGARLARLILRDLDRKEVNCALPADTREALRFLADRATKRRKR